MYWKNTESYTETKYTGPKKKKKIPYAFLKGKIY